MKKLVATFFASILLTSLAIVNVSAAEYEVQKGDSLWTIAKEHDTTVDSLVEINELRTTTIKPKQKLMIHETYMVEKGDTLIGISKKFGVTVDDIKEWNNLQTDLIVIGQELSIHGAKVEKKEATPKQVKTKAAQVASEPAKQANTSESKPEGKTFSVTATAYTAKCEGCSGITYTGINLNENPNAKVIAVDPNVIPLGSEVYVEGYGYATAADIGGAIKGNKIDIHVPTDEQAYSWGVRTVNITILK